MQAASEAAGVSRLAWRLAGTVLAVSLAAAALAGVHFAHALKFLATFALCVGPLLLLRRYARWRGLGDDRLPVFIDVVATYMIVAFALVVAQQAAGTRHVPDATALVQRLDLAFGFRWFDYVQRVSSVPGLDTVLALCYRNWIGEFVVAMAALAYVRDYKAIGEFTIAYILTSAVTLACFAGFDVLSLNSAAAFHLPGFHHPSTGGPDYLSALRRLRSGEDTTLDFSRIEGMIALPSLHGASAILLAAATRGLRMWRYPFFVFNVLVLVSTLSEGGHYLIDEIAGVLLACAALVVSAPLYRAWLRAAETRFSAVAPVAAAAS